MTHKKAFTLIELPVVRKRGGFTLIELLIVIAIIGILATVVIMNVSGARNKAADSKIKSDLSTIFRGMETYKALVNPTMLGINFPYTNGGVDSFDGGIDWDASADPPFGYFSDEAASLFVDDSGIQLMPSAPIPPKNPNNDLLYRLSYQVGLTSASVLVAQRLYSPSGADYKCCSTGGYACVYNGSSSPGWKNVCR